tara:strand:- start:181 stop:552 length:372 start_codon:yes stop_codon:yes gene_type:complete
MSSLTFNNKTFTIWGSCEVPQWVLQGQAKKLVAVDSSVVGLARDWEYPECINILKRLGIVDLADWEVVGEFYQDDTHWCPVEEKIEYCYTHDLLLAPRELVQKHCVKFDFEDQAAGLGFVDYA